MKERISNGATCGRVDWNKIPSSQRPSSSNRFNYYMFRGGEDTFLNWIEIGEYGAYTTGGAHYGIDLTNSKAGKTENAPIYSVGSGAVYRARWNSVYGNYVVLDIGNRKVYFTHMKSNLQVIEGQNVTRRNQLGVVGNTGSSSQGNHLHFELRNSSTGGDIHTGTRVISESYNPTKYYPRGTFVCSLCVYNSNHTCKYK